MKFLFWWPWKNLSHTAEPLFSFICRSIHPIINITMNSTSFSFSALPFSNPCHFWIYFRQQVAVACWAMKTGCPLIGVCFPSFLGYSGATLEFMKSLVCFLIISMPLFSIYCLSFPVSVNFDLKEDRFKALSVRNISPGIFVAVYLIDFRLNANADIRHKIQAWVAE